MEKTARVLAGYILTLSFFLNLSSIASPMIANPAQDSSIILGAGNSLRTLPIWRAVLFVYSSIDVNYLDANQIWQHFAYTITESEKAKAIWSFRQYISNTQRLSDNQAYVTYDIIYVNRTLTTVSQLSPGYYWVSPNDIRNELDQYARPGTYDSIFIYWPQNDYLNNRQIPSWGWGLAFTEPLSWSNGATYAAVANAPEWMWESPSNDLGEVWLHEWLHGVCGFYQAKGYVIPSGGSDGGGSHGYVSSPTDGWSAFYHDLMTGNVLESGIHTGITAEAWQTGSVLGTTYNASIDHYFTNSLTGYSSIGSVSWQSNSQNIFLGSTSNPSHNALYKDTIINDEATLTGRVYIPSSNIGIYDSVAIAMKSETDEYWATLAYGTLLPERGKISIMLNDSWGELFPINLQAGWYTLKTHIDQSGDYIQMKAWSDQENEPDWQLTRAIDSTWRVAQAGFRHYGLGIAVDDFYFLGDWPVEYTSQIYFPLVNNQSQSR